MSGQKHRLSVTLAQATYLRDLITDDLDATRLTTSERQQARSLLRKLNELIHRRWDASTFDPSSTGQDQQGWRRSTQPAPEGP